jgi:pentatricopeptide repeat protein
MAESRLSASGFGAGYEVDDGYKNYSRFPEAMARVDVFRFLGEEENANTIQAHHYNEAMTVLSKLGDVNGCIRILNSMLSRGMKVHRTTMNCLIAACAKAGEAHAAERWWRQMAQMGQSPNRATYASVIHAWVKAGDMCRAEEWLLAMRNAGYSPAKGFCRPIAHILLQADDNGEDIDPAVSLQQGCDVEIKRADRATHWLLHFKDLGVLMDRSTINLLMSVYARNAEYGKAEQWIQHMMRAGISPNQSTFHALILAHIYAGKLEPALNWLQQMRKMGFEPGEAVVEALQNLQSGSRPAHRRVDQQPWGGSSMPLQVMASNHEPRPYSIERELPGVPVPEAMLQGGMLSSSLLGPSAPSHQRRPAPGRAAASAASYQPNSLPSRGPPSPPSQQMGSMPFRGSPPAALPSRDMSQSFGMQPNGKGRQPHLDSHNGHLSIDPMLEASVTQILNASLAAPCPKKGKGTGGESKNASSGRGRGKGKKGKGRWPQEYAPSQADGLGGTVAGTVSSIIDEFRSASSPSPNTAMALRPGPVTRQHQLQEPIFGLQAT